MLLLLLLLLFGCPFKRIKLATHIDQLPNLFVGIFVTPLEYVT